MRAWAWTGSLFLLAASADATQPASPAALADTLARTARRVETYYTRARTLVSTERVLIQPLGLDLLPTGLGRRLVYDLRVEWEPPADGVPGGAAQVVRTLLSINGRPPSPGNDPGCIDPTPASPEPLAVFVPPTRERYAFTLVGPDEFDGRASVMVDYKHAMPPASEITWKDDCVTIDVPAQTIGRAWLDAETGDVLRLDERFVGQFDLRVPREHQRHGAASLMTIVRNDTSIRYRPFEFTDPDETLLLPARIDTVSIVRNAGSPRVRVTQTFSDYRRFTTGSRVVK